MGVLQPVCIEGFSEPVVDLGYRESLGDGRDAHHLHEKGISGPEHAPGFEREGFETGCGHSLGFKAGSDRAYRVDEVVGDLFLLIIDHGHDPIDLDVDDPDQGKGDQ